MPLTVSNLSVKSENAELIVDVSFHCKEGERVALVGESGSGKSIAALSVLKLLPENLKVNGKIEVNGKEVLKLEGEELRRFRWKEVSIVFQDPSSSLNPLMTVGEQIGEALIYHGFRGTKEELRKRVLELLKLVKIPMAEERIDSFPHHLSGGLKQRVAIAMALACEPRFLIADEPTTALDVTVQREILSLLRELSEERKIGIILITHDMGVVEEFSDKTFVIYSGFTVEEGETREIFRAPLHPYTKGLIESSPKLGKVKNKGELPSIPGNVPEPTNRPPGCPFHPRCKFSEEICKKKVPPIKTFKNRKVRCFFPLKANLIT